MAFTMGGNGGGAAPEADGLVIDGTDAGFMTDVVEPSKQVPVLVDFWAPWCGPCRSMAPEFEKAARALAPHARLAKINTQVNGDAAQRYGIRGIPALILFQNGQETARLTGARPAAQIEAFVRQHAAPRT